MKERFKEFDGMRGIAILMVLATHILPQAESYFSNTITQFLTASANMGWAGVDLFFVLSGFLITGILLEHKEKEHYFRNFYARRILRIFPVYYLTLTLLLIGYFFIGAADSQSIFITGFWFYSYLQNWVYANNSGPGLYFGHLWSLAIEEQFYLVWPLIVYFASTKALLRIGGVLTIVAFMIRIFFTFFLGNMEIINTFPYYSTLSRMDSLIIGALVAIALQSKPILWKLDKDAPKLFILSVVLIVACIAANPASPVWNNRAMLTIGFTSLAIFSACLIIMLKTRPENHLLRVIFRHPVLTFFGKYSYALYIFHWIVTSIAITAYPAEKYPGAGSWFLFAGGCYLATIVLALLSWNLIEKQALKFKRHFE